MISKFKNLYKNILSASFAGMIILAGALVPSAAWGEIIGGDGSGGGPGLGPSKLYGNGMEGLNSDPSLAEAEAEAWFTANEAIMRTWLDTINSVNTMVEEQRAAGQEVDWLEVGSRLGMSYTDPAMIQMQYDMEILGHYYSPGAKTQATVLDAYLDYMEGGIAAVDPELQDTINYIIREQGCVPGSTTPQCDYGALQTIADGLRFYGIDVAPEGIGDLPPPTEEGGNPDLVGDGDGNATGSFFDVSYMLSQIEKQIPALIRLVIAIGYLSGFIMLVLAIMKLKAYGQQTVMSSQHAQLGPSISYFVFGTILMFLPSMVNIATNSVMTGGGDAAYSYAGSTSDFGYAQLFSAIIAIIRLVGYIAFLRGWLILSKTGGHGAQPGNLGKGIIHLVGGILAINIISTWEIVKASFGFVW